MKPGYVQWPSVNHRTSLVVGRGANAYRASTTREVQCNKRTDKALVVVLLFIFIAH